MTDQQSAAYEMCGSLEREEWRGHNSPETHAFPAMAPLQLYGTAPPAKTLRDTAITELPDYLLTPPCYL